MSNKDQQQLDDEFLAFREKELSTPTDSLRDEPTLDGIFAEYEEITLNCPCWQCDYRVPEFKQKLQKLIEAEASRREKKRGEQVLELSQRLRDKEIREAQERLLDELESEISAAKPLTAVDALINLWRERIESIITTKRNEIREKK